MNIRRIAISTGGGDAPGLNAVIRSVVLSACNLGWEVMGIRDGFDGLLRPERFPSGGLDRLTPEEVEGITALGGTIIGTTNQGDPRRFPVTGPDGKITEVNRIPELAQALRESRIDALVSVGGDGSMGIATELHDAGFPVVGVPKTIDNDLSGTVITFGFDTAVEFATQCIDRLHTTARSHRRVIVVEVMGRYAGWIALNAGISGGADVVIIPEVPYQLEKIAEHLRRRGREGHTYSIVVVAEGAKATGGDASVIEKEAGKMERLGGVGERLAKEIAHATGRDTRAVVLGHLLRGGSPTTFDRLIGLRFGSAAVRAIAEGKSGVMVALAPPTVNYVPLEVATSRMKFVPLDSDTMLTARSLGICFGD